MQSSSHKNSWALQKAYCDNLQKYNFQDYPRFIIFLDFEYILHYLPNKDSFRFLTYGHLSFITNNYLMAPACSLQHHKATTKGQCLFHNKELYHAENLPTSVMNT